MGDGVGDEEVVGGGGWGGMGGRGGAPLGWGRLRLDLHESHEGILVLTEPQTRTTSSQDIISHPQIQRRSSPIHSRPNVTSQGLNVPIRVLPNYNLEQIAAPPGAVVIHSSQGSRNSEIKKN